MTSSIDDRSRLVVAIPVMDEVERIGPCLVALDRQVGARAAAVVLVVNNTTDGTAGVVRAMLPGLAVRVDVIEHVFAPEVASAGAARRMAMELGTAVLGGAGALLTTDADGRVGPDWLAANLFHLRQGADAVCGRAVLEPAEAALIPAQLHADDALECAYAAALDEIAALLDPDPWDPWPRHTEHSGASLAVTLSTYRRVGGMPAAALAEDRRFMAALRRADARVRHAPEIEVVVSGRTVGRAEGGMADTIRRRLGGPDPYLDDALEPVADFVRRLALRGRCRDAWQSGVVDAGLAEALVVERGVVETALRAEAFGAAWDAVEAVSPALARRLVAVRAVRRELAAAADVLAVLRQPPPAPDGSTPYEKRKSAAVSEPGATSANVTVLPPARVMTAELPPDIAA